MKKLLALASLVMIGCSAPAYVERPTGQRIGDDVTTPEGRFWCEEHGGRVVQIDGALRCR